MADYRWPRSENFGYLAASRLLGPVIQRNKSSSLPPFRRAMHASPLARRKRLPSRRRQLGREGGADLVADIPTSWTASILTAKAYHDRPRAKSAMYAAWQNCRSMNATVLDDQGKHRMYMAARRCVSYCCRRHEQNFDDNAHWRSRCALESRGCVINQKRCCVMSAQALTTNSMPRDRTCAMIAACVQCDVRDRLISIPHRVVVRARHEPAVSNIAAPATANRYSAQSEFNAKVGVIPVGRS